MYILHRIFIEIEYCQFTWLVFTPNLYLLNPKFKKLLIGRITANYFLKVCNHRARQRKRGSLLMSMEGYLIITASWLMFGISSSNPKVTSNAMRLLMIIYMNCGSRRGVSYLREIHGCLPRTILVKEFQPTSTHCKFVKLSHKLKRLYALWKRKYFINFVMIETKY